MGKLRKLCRAWDRSLQLFFLNEECLVDALHQSALTTSLPFVHTARRCYRCQLDTDQRSVRCHPGAAREVDRYSTSRGSKSRNKVAVGEPAAGSLRKYGLSYKGGYKFIYTGVTFGWRHPFSENGKRTTHNSGCLGSLVDEGRGDMR